MATPETEERLLAVGRAGSACQIERIVRGWRRVDQIAEARETAHRHKSRALHVYQDEDGMVVVRGRLTPEAGALLIQALAAARGTLYQQGRGSLAASALENVSSEGIIPLTKQAAANRRGGLDIGRLFGEKGAAETSLISLPRRP